MAAWACTPWIAGAGFAALLLSACQGDEGASDTLSDPHGDDSVDARKEPTGDSAAANADPYCCTLRTLCSECACEPDVAQIGHNGDDAACERYLETGSYGCGYFDEGDAVVACESGRGVAIDEERLTCAANDELFVCECALGGQPPAHLDIPVTLCDLTAFSPATVCCVPVTLSGSDCWCAGVLCTDGSSECRCGTETAASGVEECAGGAFDNCCLQANTGDCVCSDRECEASDVRVPSCSIYDVTCPWLDLGTANEVLDCSESGIQTARAEPVTPPVSVLPPTLPEPSPAPEPSPPSLCGNGALEIGEACDDANTTPGDGCEPDCTATSDPVCGDGVAGPAEECDDGNSVQGDGCEPDCTTSSGPACGDGTVNVGEECDDGNATSGDGCEPDCTETPFVVCGDGVLGPGEECDDANTTSGDGCEPDCRLTR